MNIIDIIVIGIVLLSGVLAFFRGFVHEVLSVAAWVGAGFAAMYGLPLARPIAQQYISSPTIADLASGAVLFLVSLLLLSILTKQVANRVHDSALNSVDRSLGFVFGAVRGAVLVSLAYILGVWLIQPGELPQWLTEAKTQPAMERGAAILESFVPDSLGAAKDKTREAQDQARKAMELQRAYQNLANPQPRGATATISPAPVSGGTAAAAPAAAGGQAQQPKMPADAGYNPSERRDMDRLFKSNQ